MIEFKDLEAEVFDYEDLEDLEEKETDFNEYLSSNYDY